MSGNINNNEMKEYLIVNIYNQYCIISICKTFLY